jgi:uncharacterized hydantoinase/oxoprolinase family protein
LDIAEGEGQTDEVQLGYLPLWKIK